MVAKCCNPGLESQGIYTSWNASDASSTRTGLSQVLINHDFIFIIDILGLQPFNHLHLWPLEGHQSGMAWDLLQYELSEVFRKLQINAEPFQI